MFADDIGKRETRQRGGPIAAGPARPEAPCQAPLPLPSSLLGAVCLLSRENARRTNGKRAVWALGGDEQAEPLETATATAPTAGVTSELLPSPKMAAEGRYRGRWSGVLRRSGRAHPQQQHQQQRRRRRRQLRRTPHRPAAMVRPGGRRGERRRGGGARDRDAARAAAPLMRLFSPAVLLQHVRPSHPPRLPEPLLHAVPLLLGIHAGRA